MATRDLEAYFDTAGHPDDLAGKALVVCGNVSSLRTWKRFDARWHEALETLGIASPFHMTYFMASREQYTSWRGRGDEKTSALMKLARLARRNVHKTFGECIQLDDWRHVNATYQMERWHLTPFALASFLVMDKMMRWWNRSGQKYPFARFTFESGDRHRGDYMWLVERLARPRPNMQRGGNKAVRDFLMPNFASKSLAGLQLADFIGWEHRHLAKQRLSLPLEQFLGVRPTFLELEKIPRDWGFMDVRTITMFCEDFKVPKYGDGREWDPFPV